MSEKRLLVADVDQFGFLRRMDEVDHILACPGLESVHLSIAQLPIETEAAKAVVARFEAAGVRLSLRPLLMEGSEGEVLRTLEYCNEIGASTLLVDARLGLEALRRLRERQSGCLVVASTLPAGWRDPFDRMVRMVRPAQAERMLRDGIEAGVGIACTRAQLSDHHALLAAQQLPRVLVGNIEIERDDRFSSALRAGASQVFVRQPLFRDFAETLQEAWRSINRQ